MTPSEKTKAIVKILIGDTCWFRPSLGKAAGFLRVQAVARTAECYVASLFVTLDGGRHLHLAVFFDGTQEDFTRQLLRSTKESFWFQERACYPDGPFVCVGLWHGDPEDEDRLYDGQKSAMNEVLARLGGLAKRVAV